MFGGWPAHCSPAVGYCIVHQAAQPGVLLLPGKTTQVADHYLEC
jgi:hypothetical protein